MSIRGKAFLTWFVLLAVMFGNGTLRVLALQPRFGETLGRQLSAATGVCLIFALSGLLVRRLGPVSRGDLLGIGFMWLALTLAFEFLFGHYVSGASWEALLADYNLASGRLWPLVLAATFLSPLLWGAILTHRK